MKDLEPKLKEPFEDLRRVKSEFAFELSKITLFLRADRSELNPESSLFDDHDVNLFSMRDNKLDTWMLELASQDIKFAILKRKDETTFTLGMEGLAVKERHVEI